MKEIEEWQKNLKIIDDGHEGIGRFDPRVLQQEGVPHEETYRNWRKDCKDKLEKLDSFKGEDYKIPAIEHAVFFTSNSSPKELKDEYVQKLSDTAKRLKAVNPNFRHILWTNNPDIRDIESVQKILKEVPNLEIKTIYEFADHPLQQNLSTLIEKGQQDSRAFVEASDIARVMVAQKYGGVYHDLDYEIFDAQAMVSYMKSFNYFNGREEHNRYDSFSGNAFIATAPHHPVIEKAAQLIKRNLDKGPDAPKYIHEPLNKFDSVICTTGPSVLNIAYHLEGNKHGNNDMMFPGNVLYNADFARDKSSDKLLKPLPVTDFEGIEVKTVGGDMFLGGWGNSPEYANRKLYGSGELIVPASSITLYNTLEAIKKNDITSFVKGISKLDNALDKILKITQKLEREEMVSQIAEAEYQKKLGKDCRSAINSGQLQKAEEILEEITDQEVLRETLTTSMLYESGSLKEQILEKVTDPKTLGLTLLLAKNLELNGFEEKILKKVIDQNVLGEALNTRICSSLQADLMLVDNILEKVIDKKALEGALDYTQRKNLDIFEKITARINALNTQEGFLSKANEYLKTYAMTPTW
jgi:mannosyltransferase OCH1-like enzyme